MTQVAERIKTLVRGLFEDKQASKELEDSIDKDSAELKKWMAAHKAEEMMVDDIKVAYKPQVRSSMDEGKTIDILRAIADDAVDEEQRQRILGCIHTREYVDEAELESLIYDDIVSKQDLEPAMMTNTIFVLRLSRSRKKG